MLQPINALRQGIDRLLRNGEYSVVGIEAAYEKIFLLTRKLLCIHACGIAVSYPHDASVFNVKQELLCR